MMYRRRAAVERFWSRLDFARHQGYKPDELIRIIETLG